MSAEALSYIVLVPHLQNPHRCLRMPVIICGIYILRLLFWREKGMQGVQRKACTHVKMNTESVAHVWIHGNIPFLIYGFLGHLSDSLQSSK